MRKQSRWLGSLSSGVGAGLALLASIDVIAGTESSGGGNAIVCFDDPAIANAINDKNSPNWGKVLNSQLSNIVSIVAYDLWEAMQARGAAQQAPDIIALKAGETPEMYYDRILSSRLDHYVPPVAGILKWGKEKLPMRNIFFVDGPLAPIDDVDPTLPDNSPNCARVTMAKHFYDAGGAYTLHIDKRLYQHPEHSALSQAVLLAHERVFLYARVNDRAFDMAGQPTDRRVLHKSSKPTRKLVSMLITNDPEVSPSTLIMETNALGFTRINPNGQQIFPSAMMRTIGRAVEPYSSNLCAWRDGALGMSKSREICRVVQTNPDAVALRSLAKEAVALLNEGYLKLHPSKPLSLQAPAISPALAAEILFVTSKLFNTQRKTLGKDLNRRWEQLRQRIGGDFDDEAKNTFLAKVRGSVVAQATTEIFASLDKEGMTEWLPKVFINQLTANELAKIRDQLETGVRAWLDQEVVEAIFVKPEADDLFRFHDVHPTFKYELWDYPKGLAMQLAPFQEVGATYLKTFTEARLPQIE